MKQCWKAKVRNGWLPFVAGKDVIVEVELIREPDRIVQLSLTAGEARRIGEKLIERADWLEAKAAMEKVDV